MSKRNQELFLFDIVIACEKIRNYTTGFDDAQALKYDCKSWDAVIREFEIIGEAVNNLIKMGYYPNDKREIVDFRNVLIHEYFGIDEDEVWDIIINYLDELKYETINNIQNIKKDKKEKIIEYFIEYFIEENKHIKFVVQLLESLKYEK